MVTPPGLEPGTNSTKNCCATDYTTGYRAKSLATIDSTSRASSRPFLAPDPPLPDGAASSFGHIPTTMSKKSSTSSAARAGISFGCALAITISWSLHKSVLWAILHGIFSWFYVLYYCVT